MTRFVQLLVPALLLGAAGCVSVLPEQTAPEALYRVAPAQDSFALETRIVVREPEAPRILGGQGMVSEAADGGLKLVGGAEWAGRATKLLQLALVDRFAPSGDELEGYAVASAMGAPGEYELAWRVSDLALAGNRAVCRLDLILMDATTRAPVASQRVSGTADAPGRSPSQRAQALSRAAGACVDEAARFLAGASRRDATAPGTAADG